MTPTTARFASFSDGLRIQNTDWKGKNTEAICTKKAAIENPIWDPIYDRTIVEAMYRHWVYTKKWPQKNLGFFVQIFTKKFTSPELRFKIIGQVALPSKIISRAWNRKSHAWKLFYPCLNSHFFCEICPYFGPLVDGIRFHPNLAKKLKFWLRLGKNNMFLGSPNGGTRN